MVLSSKWGDGGMIILTDGTSGALGRGMIYCYVGRSD